jgi:WD40 repeat protein
LQRGPGEDPTARLWDGETGALVAVLRGHTDWVSDAQFSVDGKQIITISNDGTARVWDGVTGTPLLVLKGHSFWVQDAVYSPDRRWLATGGVEDESQTTEALLWPTFPTTQEAVDFAKLKVPRCLTPEQRLRFFLPPQVPSWCVEKRKWPYRTP